MCDYATLAPVDEKRVVALRHSLEYPNEIFIVDKKSDKQLTNVTVADNICFLNICQNI